MLYTGNGAEPVRFGLEVQPHQCNRLGFCHGGLLSTYLDIALGVCAIEICGHDWGGPTINLSAGSVVGSPGKIARATALFKQPRPAPITA